VIPPLAVAPGLIAAWIGVVIASVAMGISRFRRRGRVDRADELPGLHELRAECPQCGERFPDATELQAHVARFHA
jgi:hypothetical protein